VLDRAGGERGGDVAVDCRVRLHNSAKATLPARWQYADMWAPPLSQDRHASVSWTLA